MAFRCIVAATAIFLVSTPRPEQHNSLPTLLGRYEECVKAADRRQLETRIARYVLEEGHVLDELADGSLDLDAISCNITHAQVTTSLSAYIICAGYERLGVVAVVVKQKEPGDFLLLPLINTGADVTAELRDITGDGDDEMILRGQGWGTGYSSKWIAVYKYRDLSMVRVCAVDYEIRSSFPDGTEEVLQTEVSFVDAADRRGPALHQKGFRSVLGARSGVPEVRESVDNLYVWSKDRFAFELVGSDLN